MKHWFILSAGFLSTYCLQLLAAGAGVMGWTSQCSCSQALTAPGPGKTGPVIGESVSGVWLINAALSWPHG